MYNHPVCHALLFSGLGDLQAVMGLFFRRATIPALKDLFVIDITVLRKV